MSENRQRAITQDMKAKADQLDHFTRGQKVFGEFGRSWSKLTMDAVAGGGLAALGVAVSTIGATLLPIGAIPATVVITGIGVACGAGGILLARSMKEKKIEKILSSKLPLSDATRINMEKLYFDILGQGRGQDSMSRQLDAHAPMQVTAGRDVSIER